MNYDLAKQLKEAGFTQFGDGTYGYPIHVCVAEMYKVVDNESMVYIPTLSELIEACGDKFGHLTRVVDTMNEGEWTCFGGDTKEKIYFTKRGHVCEEAVALLWLALNKK